MSWSDWDEEFREKQGKRKNRTKLLVNALAKRIVRQPELFEEIAHLLAPQKYTAALHPFGEQLGQCDKKRELLFSLLDKARDSKHWDCLQGYLGAVRDLNLSEFRGVIQGLLLNQSDAWLGASLALRSEYDDGLFGYCLMALEAGRIESAQFLALNWAHAWQAVPTTRIKQLIEYLYKQNQ